jgi:hypothetical protein
LAAGIGPVLRTIRQQWRLTLREVEERSLRFARERGNQSYQVSAGWLDRLEREQHEINCQQTHRPGSHLWCLPGAAIALHVFGRHPTHAPQTIARPEWTMLLMEGPLQEQAIYLLQDELCPCETAQAFCLAHLARWAAAILAHSPG